eukprot:CAMPEP_0194517534 /NCGR_PEP_ID=MMETSP0253-20130528/50733_1 /TAXON_ID=2966 /ORGANISM="Noctiluca scintillans" /LENGTH=56 /DNA_ID=CAMNT_0039361513 /DNA_START=177 /DNA_END=344 /DNA_ORIENTATION=-
MHMEGQTFILRSAVTMRSCQQNVEKTNWNGERGHGTLHMMSMFMQTEHVHVRMKAP